MLTVEQLRKRGFKVGISHYRFYHNILGGQYDLLTRREAEKLSEDRYSYDYDLVNPDSHGGRTVLTLTTPDGKSYESVADCNDLDAYNKRLGVRICLGRLFKKEELSV